MRKKISHQKGFENRVHVDLPILSKGNLNRRIGLMIYDTNFLHAHLYLHVA